jgi:phage terminase large subunit-like protein
MNVRKTGAPKDYTAIAKQYAEAVVRGDIAGAKWVQLACQRQLNDLVKFKGKASPYQFNPKLTSKSGKSYYPADNLCAFIERLPHVKGPLAGETIKLEPWQVFILTTVFGWVKPDGNRRFRRSYIEVPRGNAKSTLSSALALYMLAADVKAGKVKTVQGSEITISTMGGVSVDNAKVVKTDIVASNGVIHVIDSVIIPK